MKLKVHFYSTALKNDIVKPVIKDEKKDQNDYKIKDLSVICLSYLKLLKNRFKSNLHFTLIYTIFMLNTEQSVYRVNHSCETATLAIYNDLLCK